MAQNDIHEPELPGVKTYTKDIDDANETSADGEGSFFGVHLKKSIGKDKTMHSPQEIVETGTRLHQRDSILSNRDSVFDVSRAFDERTEIGTIVTDKRKKYLSLRGMFKNAFDEWYTNTGRNLSAMKIFQKEERPMIGAVEDRKDIVTQAGEHTKQIPHDDHKVVIEKLKTLEHDAERVTKKPFHITKRSSPQAPTWSHSDNDEIPPSPVIQTAPPSPVKPLERIEIPPDIPDTPMTTRVEGNTDRKVPYFIFPTKKEEGTPAEPPLSQMHAGREAVIEKEIESTVTPIQKEPAQLEPEDHIPLAQHETKHDELKKAGWSFLVDDDENENTKEETEGEPVQKGEPRLPVAPQPHVPTEDTFHGNSLGEIDYDIPLSKVSETKLHPQKIKPLVRGSDKRSLGILILIVVVIFSSLAGVFAALYFAKQETAVTVTQNEIITPSFFLADYNNHITFVENSFLFLTALHEAILNGEHGSAHIIPVALDKSLTVEERVATGRVFEILAPHADSAFIRTLEDTGMIGYITTTVNEPFIIVQSNAFDTAFAGMLNWEPYMSTDLTPLFGPELSGAAGHFIDATNQNRGVRILYDELGNEHIVYAFVNRNTIVITTSTEALATVLDNMQ